MELKFPEIPFAFVKARVSAELLYAEVMVMVAVAMLELSGSITVAPGSIAWRTRLRLYVNVVEVVVMLGPARAAVNSLTVVPGPLAPLVPLATNRLPLESKTTRQGPSGH